MEWFKNINLKDRTTTFSTSIISQQRVKSLRKWADMEIFIRINPFSREKANRKINTIRKDTVGFTKKTRKVSSNLLRNNSWLGLIWSRTTCFIIIETYNYNFYYKILNAVFKICNTHYSFVRLLHLEPRYKRQHSRIQASPFLWSNQQY